MLCVGSSMRIYNIRRFKPDMRKPRPGYTGRSASHQKHVKWRVSYSLIRLRARRLTLTQIRGICDSGHDLAQDYPTAYIEREVMSINDQVIRAVRPGHISYPILKYIQCYLSALRVWHREELTLFQSQVDVVRQRLVR